MSASELAEWERYWMEEPFGADRQTHLTASLIQAILNSFSTQPVSFEYVMDKLIPHYSLGNDAEADLAAEIQANLAQIEAWKAEGKVIDMRGKRKA